MCGWCDGGWSGVSSCVSVCHRAIVVAVLSS